MAVKINSRKKALIHKLQDSNPLAAKLGETLVDPDKFLYNHSKNVWMDPSGGVHYYKYDDQTEEDVGYPSVTTILSAVQYNKFIVGWANGLGRRGINYEDELARTARIGTAMHAAAQEYVDPSIKDVYAPENPMDDYYVRKRMRTLKERLEIERPWHTYFTETAFIDRDNGFAGTIDWFLQFRGLPTIGDFKSAKGMRDKFLYQLGGYVILLENNGIAVDQVMNVLPGEETCAIWMFPKSVIEKAKASFLLAKKYAEDHSLIAQLVDDKKYILSKGWDPNGGKKK